MHSRDIVCNQWLICILVNHRRIVCARRGAVRDGARSSRRALGSRVADGGEQQGGGRRRAGWTRPAHGADGPRQGTTPGRQAQLVREPEGEERPDLGVDAPDFGDLERDAALVLLHPEHALLVHLLPLEQLPVDRRGERRV